MAPDLAPKTIDSDVIPCPYVDYPIFSQYVDLTSEQEVETANGTDLAHFPMVESDIETIIPNLAPDLAPDLASETIVYYPEVTRVYCKPDMWDKTLSTKVG